jgi:prepilin-type N-terminal cleavage/methylation domain-containing protein
MVARIASEGRTLRRMRIRTPLQTASAQRRGFSIVEVIVAMMILTVGLLGIAGSTTMALRTALDVTRRRDAIERAESRLAQVAAGGCTRASSGSATDAGRQLTEQWSVRAAGHFQQVTDSITWVGASGRRTFALSTAIPC